MCPVLIAISGKNWFEYPNHRWTIRCVMVVWSDSSIIVHRDRSYYAKPWLEWAVVNKWSKWLKVIWKFDQGNRWNSNNVMANCSKVLDSGLRLPMPLTDPTPPYRMLHQSNNLQLCYLKAASIANKKNSPLKIWTAECTSNGPISRENRKP